MRKNWLLAGSALMVVGAMAVPAGRGREDRPLRVASLGFMAGSWQAQQGEIRMEEHWTAPAAGCMMGMFRQVRGATTSVREFEIIEETTDGVVMTIKHFTP